MFDNSQRSMWLEQAYVAICKRYGYDAKNILIGASYPPAGARGALERVRPADFDTQWRGNDNEKDGFLSIHPLSFKPVGNEAVGLSTLRATLWALARTHHGVRHGAARVGLSKNDDATLSADAETTAKLQSILDEIGPPPSGYSEPFPVRKVQRTRMVTYVCACAKDNRFTATNRNKDVTCNKCGVQFTPLP
jgi:hypothetical protein